METFIAAAIEQAFALICAVLIVSYVEPTSRGGAIFLGIVSIAAVNVIVQWLRFILQLIRKGK